MPTPQPDQTPPLEQVLGSAAVIDGSRLEGEGPDGRLPLTPDMLRNEPSGTIFGLTQNAGTGWRPEAMGGPQYVIVSTMGGLRSEYGDPIALGYHTGHWKSGCSCVVLSKRCAKRVRSRLPCTAAIRATVARRARRGCSTASPIATTPR